MTVLIFLFFGNAIIAQDRGPRVARILWQDQERNTLMWGEVHGGSKWIVSASPIPGFPAIDTISQNMVRMKQADGVLMVVMNSVADGDRLSGWVAVDTGVREEPHGDHSHWQFVAKPSVRGSRIDKNPGNRLQLSLYNERFYVTGGTRNGFTRFAPSELLSKSAAECGSVYSGAAGYGPVAVVDDTVAYAVRTESPADHSLIDVISLKASGEDVPVYSFTVPAGGIHAATTNSGRVFLAAADRICRVDADLKLSGTGDSIVVNQIDLGMDRAVVQPNQGTGFVNHRNYVLFSAEEPGRKFSLCLLDAKSASPSLVKVPVEVDDGLSLTSPEVVLASGGRRYAFLFHDRTDRDSSAQEKLTIVDLDPNGDRNLSDARIVRTIPVGRSGGGSTFGQRSVSFCSEGRIACFTNPGDGTIWVMTLRDLTVRARSIVRGVPTGIVTIGAPEHKH